VLFIQKWFARMDFLVMELTAVVHSITMVCHGAGKTRNHPPVAIHLSASTTMDVDESSMTT
jgi:hypothetical protein